MPQSPPRIKTSMSRVEKTNSRMLKMSGLLTRPTLARRDVLFPSKAAASNDPRRTLWGATVRRIRSTTSVRAAEW